jgi:hypothetical protein
MENNEVGMAAVCAQKIIKVSNIKQLSLSKQSAYCFGCGGFFPIVLQNSLSKKA